MSIEGLDGDGLPNPCQRCGKHSTQPGTPNFSERVATYLCPYCSMQWTRHFDDQRVVEGDVVRVDLDDGYAYGGVVRIERDRVLVRVDDPPRSQEWVDLWRVIVY